MKTILFLILFSISLLGCNKQTSSTNQEDFEFLRDTQSELPKNSMTLLPLETGNRWDMLSRGNEKTYKDIISVKDIITIDKNQGFLLTITRDGGLWRQEVYQNSEQGLFLLAFGEKKRDLLLLSPPLPLALNPVLTGNQTTWTGKIRFGKQVFQANGFTRVTTVETIQTKTGRFQCYRLDSIITMNHTGNKKLHFPTIRWISENTGFIQRSFADEGKPAVQLLEKFKRNEQKNPSNAKN